VPAQTREAAGADAAGPDKERLTPQLSIGEISRLTNVSPSTLRDWENHGIIRPRRNGTRRRYTMADVERVRTASELRRQAFSPAAIAATLEPQPAGRAAARRQGVETGRILRQARLEHGASLREVASAVNVSVSHLSTIERGGVQPSLALLQRLAACYSIDVADLFGGPSAAEPRVRKLSESEVLLSDEGRVRVQAVARSAVICSDVYEADPGGSSGGSYEHDGEECALVLEGTADFVFNETDTRTLSAGESVSFNSRIPHRWVNSGPGVLRMIWTNARPPRASASNGGGAADPDHG
jgi:DNA-binding transcriptional MerR regulator/mannose-6-phosphate isomerase-like protein (cupin superfamily)